MIYWIDEPALYADTSIVWVGEWGTKKVSIIPTRRIIWDSEEDLFELGWEPKALLIHSCYASGGYKNVDWRSLVINNNGTTESAWIHWKLSTDSVQPNWNTDIVIHRDWSRNSYRNIEFTSTWFKIVNAGSGSIDINVSIVALW